MNNFDALTRALGYIERNLTDDVDMTELAKYSCVSLSALQKIFRYTFDYSIKEYVSKRKLTVAARGLLETQNTVIDIALKCGYNSPETFTRAFRRFWGMSPSEFRKNGTFTEIFPEIIVEETTNEQYHVYKNNAEMYDYLLENKNIFIICFDVVGLININKISREIGDRVIMEAVKRINSIREDSMPLFRLGGDEFALLVTGKGIDYCFQVEQQVTEWNKNPLSVDGMEVPVVLRTWIGRNMIDDSARATSQNLIHKVKHAWDSKPN